ncbi:isoprenylcysteine alpha-carbonyl methylesterase ICME-like isoform X3 [Camellia sinensis]|uniref:isoprenylcysteine alpha-carbonyl methylesterase ICME-like isoform X3 n=1 Tax=Camellia sinensis TaxID=4442 RepID=UPI0010360FB7|nr:isoprenylcysteine alpha-carbonyl methylesterase ICME-like isoform X3 [Camellia sinensis]
MQSQILPLSNPCGTMAVEKMLLRSAEEDVSVTRLLISPQFEGERAIEVKPIFPSASSYISTATGGSKFFQKRRRRTAGESSLAGGGGKSFGEGIEDAASETNLMTRLGFNLLRYLGVGYRGITRLLAIGCYAFLIFPGFIQVAFYYFFSRQVHRGIVYGDQPRNRLDLYLPKNTDGPKPVVSFVTGGAWIIGYKAWGCLLGKQLSERDIIVACIDYRNFPQGTMSDMIKDSSEGISFVCNHIAEYGGDPNRIYLMGQSAGAHIAACSLLEQAIKEAGDVESTSWSVSQLKAYFGLSGGKNFAGTLQRVGGKAESILYDGRTHTDIFVQDPMRGGKDQMFEDIVARIHARDSAALAKDAVAPPRKRLVPEFMLKLANSVSPF